MEKRYAIDKNHLNRKACPFYALPLDVGKDIATGRVTITLALDQFNAITPKKRDGRTHKHTNMLPIFCACPTP